MAARREPLMSATQQSRIAALQRIVAASGTFACTAPVDDTSPSTTAWHPPSAPSQRGPHTDALRRHIGQLQHRSTVCSKIADSATSLVGTLRGLEARHGEVSAKARSLHEQCNALGAQQRKLRNTVDRISAPLAYFTDLQRISRSLGMPLNADATGPAPVVEGVSRDDVPPPGSDEFFALLERVDDCISFLVKHPTFHDASKYTTRYRHLETRALAIVKDQVLSVVGAAATAAETMFGSGERGAMPAVPSDAAVSKHMYIEFRSSCADVAALVDQIEQRASRKRLTELALEVYAGYLDHRLRLLSRLAQLRLAAIPSSDNVLAMARAGCSYMVQLVETEYKLFVQLFGAAPRLAAAQARAAAARSVTEEGGASATDAPAKPARSPQDYMLDATAAGLVAMLEELSTCLEDYLRPAILQQSEVQVLAELVFILNTEVLQDQVQARGVAARGLEPAVSKMVRDAQERLIYRVARFIQDDVDLFEPEPADIDYPRFLEDLKARRAAGERVNMYSSWYPTLRMTLQCLSKTYRCVGAAIFESLAQEAVSTCGASLVRASELIRTKTGHIDADLFLIKYLLILREQITPFDIDFTVTEKQLDFSNTADAFSSFLSRSASLFTFSLDNPLLSLLARGLPSVAESRVDSKRNLEADLKTACEAFFARTTSHAVPLLQFIAKATKFTKSPTEDQLHEQPWATAERQEELVQAMRVVLQTVVPTVRAKVSVYLVNPDTQRILFRPIKTHLVGAFNSWMRLLAAWYPQDIRDALEPTVAVLCDLAERCDLAPVEPAGAGVAVAATATAEGGASEAGRASAGAGAGAGAGNGSGAPAAAPTGPIAARVAPTVAAAAPDAVVLPAPADGAAPS